MHAMTIMERCRNAQTDIDRIRQRILRRRDAIESITAHADDVGGSHGSSDPDKIGRFVAEIDRLNDQAQRREKARSAEIAAVCEMLDALPDNEADVLHKWYIGGRSMRGIARSLHYTEGYCRKLKSAGDARIMEIEPEAVDRMLPEWYLQEWP